MGFKDAAFKATTGFLGVATLATGALLTASLVSGFLEVNKKVRARKLYL